jgi:hypothetical protein
MKSGVKLIMSQSNRNKAQKCGQSKNLRQQGAQVSTPGGIRFPEDSDALGTADVVRSARASSSFLDLAELLPVD